MDFSHWTEHRALQSWIEEVHALCAPKDVHLCDGSEEEYQAICQQLVSTGTFLPLNPAVRPRSFLCRSDPSDVARIEDRTFICSSNEADAGPTNHWSEPEAMKKKLQELFFQCMRGRIMYVIPFSMGPIGSPLALIGVQITDSPYVVANTFLMTRMGKKALDVLDKKGAFIPCLHSVGVPLAPNEQSSNWPCRPDAKYIVHFPEERRIVSFGSGYGGNALLGKKCLALRIASFQAREENWLAEHMLIVGITAPSGKKLYFAAAFPSACGKTNLAMLKPTLPGWKVECVGDDIAWMRIGKDGHLYAINPEAGFFGVAPGTSTTSNPYAMATLKKNAIFTNVALTPDGDIWWEDMTKQAPSQLIDWQGRDWTPASKDKAAHPNARFTVAAKQCPVIDPAFDDSTGVPLAGIIFGGRRSSVVPLVIESLSWQHGTFLGAALSSETTAAAAGAVGKLRHDPFAMLPFCGYHMGDYFQHWLEMGAQFDALRAPKIFHVNWFQKSAAGDFLWPGFGDNIRVLKWIFEQCSGAKTATKTALGYVPSPGALDLSGLNTSPEKIKTLLAVDSAAWKREVAELKTYFQQFEPRLPQGIKDELKNLEQRLAEVRM
ncbi:MAG: phosphoenolpyruvate carboxykinase (GTP) [Chlamydiota bacterium]